MLRTMIERMIINNIIRILINNIFSSQQDYTLMPAFDMFEKRPSRNRAEFKQQVIPENPGSVKREINISTADIFKE